MERFTISKSEKQTIYEIYRACRLCGAGGGYRMPIIQNIIDLESSEVDLSQKIQECLQLEVRQDDRMPPLICELCVDKVNAFHEFFTLARQTNVSTRTRLGLPLQTAKKGEPEQSDCILGVTEPVYVKDDEPPAKKAKAGPKCSKKIKKEPDLVKVKTETVSDTSRSSSVSSRSSRARAASPPRSRPAPRAASPPRSRPSPRAAPTHTDRKGKAESAKPAQQTPKEKERKAPKERKSELQNLLEQTPKEREKRTPKERNSEIQYLLEDNLKFDGSSARASRPRPAPAPAPAPRRTKAPPVEPEEAGAQRSRPGPKSKKKPEPKAEPPNEPVPQKQDKAKAKPKPEPAKAKGAPKPPEDETPKSFKCLICDAQMKTAQAHGNHLKWHTPTYTKPNKACDPCGSWFATREEAAAHHRHHRHDTFPYHCRRCFHDYSTLPLYYLHISSGACRGWEVRCEACGDSFAAETRHTCPAPDTSPGGKCPKCCRTYATAKSLKRHECKAGRRRDLIADPNVLRRLKPMQVRIRRCDDLVAPTRDVHGHYDVSAVKPNYGLAKRYVYPYLKFSPVKNEPLHHDSMVAIPVALKDEFATDYTHWDSSDSDSDTILRRVPSLSTLAIKKLFSKHCLGKVPRRRKRVKNEAFENDNDFGNIGNINDLINSLGDDTGRGLGRMDLTARIKDIIGCFDDSVEEGAKLDGNDNDVKIVDEGSKRIDENVDANDNDDKIVDEGSKRIDENVDANDNDDKIVDEGSKRIGQDGNLDGNDNDDKIVDEGSKDGHVTCNGDMNSGDNVNDSTKESCIQSDQCNDSEASNVETIKTAANSHTVITNDDSNHINEKNENLNRPQSENKNLDLVDKEIGVSLQESTENLIEMVAETKESENVNGIESKSNCTEETKSEETSKQINKESPIKHSIENLIGDTDKDPDKYISEVISSIEDIINKNPRNEDRTHEQLNGQTDIDNSNVMDALDNISDDKGKRISDSDKITLEDLLPKEDRPMELDDISDEDFNFDA